MSVIPADFSMCFLRKILLTILFSVFILACGFSYQYQYNHKKSEYGKIVTEYYRKYLRREPDKEGLNYWVMMAMTKWDLERVEREGFKEAAQRGAL